MSVLERILEEIIDELKEEGIIADNERGHRAVDIIRSHMDDLLDADIEEKSILCTLGEDGVLSEYDDTYDVVIHCTCKEDQEQTVKLIKDSNWIPVSERLPDGNEYILLSFSNFSLPMVGRFENGPFYLGDDDEGDTCVSQDLFVNAWRQLPEPYRPAEE